MDDRAELIERLGNLAGAQIGDRIWFRSDKRPFRVRARNERYLICTKPFNARKTVIYTIVDLVENVRGRDNLIFGLGYETEESIAENMALLAKGEMEVSRRHYIPLDFERIAAAVSSKRERLALLRSDKEAG